MAKQVVNDDEDAYCGKCGLLVNIRIAWYDPYNTTSSFCSSGQGCYVHLDCLSQKRKDEIREEGKNKVEITCAVCNKVVKVPAFLAKVDARKICPECRLKGKDEEVSHG